MPSRSASAWLANVVLPTRVDDADAFARELDDEAVALLALAERLFGPHALGDVADVEDHARDLGVGEVVRPDDLGRQPGAVGVPQPHEQRNGARVGGAERRREAFERPDLVDRVHEIERTVPMSSPARVAEHRRRGGLVYLSAPAVHDRDHVG